jgi:hypothetical protein
MPHGRSARALNPNAARVRSLLNHLLFGAGLFISALLINL